MEIGNDTGDKQCSMFVTKWNLTWWGIDSHHNYKKIKRLSIYWFLPTYKYFIIFFVNFMFHMTKKKKIDNFSFWFP